MAYPTCRRYPRSLAEAYPRDYACAVERPRRTARVMRLAGVFTAIALGVAIAALLVYGIRW